PAATALSNAGCVNPTWPAAAMTAVAASSTAAAPRTIERRIIAISSNAAVPLVALVLPVAALAAADAGEALDQLDGADVLRLLVAELALDAAAQGRAIAHRQRLVVELVGEDRLHLVRVVEVDALVVAR